MAQFDLRPLIEARAGKPTPEKAALTIATFSVIPGAILGMVVGCLLDRSTSNRFVVMFVLGGLLGGGGSFLSVMLIHRLWGFRPIVWLGDSLLGGFGGFFVGMALGWLVDSPWPLVLSPVGVVALPWLTSGVKGPSTDETRAGTTD